MKNLQRLRVAGVTASLAALVVGSGLTGSAARADIAGRTPNISYRNASDPHLTDCPDTTGGVGLCLYTSNDLNLPTDSHGNSYPMNKTYLYTLEHGQNPSVQTNWVDRGAVLQESQYSWVPSGANHLWAPAEAYGAQAGKYYLYVPDISNVSQQATSSHIGVSVSASPRGPFTYSQQIAVSGYASDPHVYVNSSGSPYLVYANGDYSNCGGLSIAPLNKDMVTLAGSAQQITINGVSALGTCGSTGHPYLEGASLYNFGSAGFTTSTPYYLVFAAKPSNSNEVIAYATSSSPTGPFTYKGTIMGGSSTEWTNQASIQKFGSSYIFAYHDGPTGTHNRKTYFECLTFVTSGSTVGNINPITRSTSNTGFTNCWKP